MEIIGLKKKNNKIHNANVAEDFWTSAKWSQTVKIY